MASFSLLGLCVFSLTQTAAALQSSAGYSVMFASMRDTVILPCAIPSTKSCTSINWIYGGHRSDDEVVRRGKVTDSNDQSFSLLWNCSLQINHMTLDTARFYICKGETLYSNISLELLQIAELATSPGETIELHCFLTDYRGSGLCSHSHINIKWSTEDNTPLNGSRFRTESPSPCFSKLFITKKLTDHHRKWRCHLTENDAVKATATHQTKVKDGIEEVFAAVGESVSLHCDYNSSHPPTGSMRWVTAREPLTEDEASSLIISKVSALDSNNYQCSETGGEQRVFNKIRLHTLDVTLQQGPETNLTFTCVLTCAQACEKDFDISWCQNNQYGRDNGSVAVNNTLISELFIPALPAEMSCCATWEGAMVASKTWHSGNSLRNLAWLVFPLGLLVCVATGGLYLYLKRKNGENAGEQSRIEMDHVYDMIREENKNKARSPIQPKEEATDSTDSFYALLQAVN